MAKNFALHGVWGVSPYEFTSSTSSPLYVLLLSGIYRLIGPSQYAPLFLSWIFGLASIYVAARILVEYLAEAWQTAVLISLVLLTPLFLIGILGMEHSLHLLLTLLFLQWFDRRTESPWIIAGITTLMVATRYEGMFMVAAGCLLLVVSRSWRRAFLIAAAAWLPVGAYALFSIVHKGYWLPNSISMKGVQIHGPHVGARLTNVLAVAISNSIRAPHLFLLLAGMAVTEFSLHKRHPRPARLLWLVVISGYMHLFTADVGWAFRYEDYLIGAGIIVTACAFPMLRDSGKAVAMSAVCLVFLGAGILITRALEAGLCLPQYSRAIYLQQWQMAIFLSDYYPGESIAANDIGLINFRNNIHCLDLTGLASSEIFSAKRSGSYSTQFLDQITSRRHVKIAVIYDSWFSAHRTTPLGGPAIPASWIRVERWKVPEQEQLGADTVSFYALTPESSRPLKEHLKEFDRTLPAAIKIIP